MLRELTLLGIVMMMANAAEPKFRQVLTSVEHGLRVPEWSLTASDLDRNSTQGWAIRKTVLRGGKQEGVDLITVANGVLTVSICPTRGMGLMDARLGNVRLGWDSPVKEVVDPRYMNLESRGGLGWLEGFNEMMVRCGLEFAGHPGKDKFINNTGDEAEMDLTLHGKIGNIPASQVEVAVDAEGTLRVRGRVDERMFYGPKLELWTELSTRPGSKSFTVKDEIRNLSAYEQEFEIIYHANFGATVLEAGSKFTGAIQRVAPFNANAAKAVQTYRDYLGPTKGFIEQVYCLFPYADAQGQTTAMLQNAAGDQAVALTYSTREMPFLTLWKNTTAVEEGYVTGLEPGTNFPFNRSVERKAGRLAKLKPGETRTFTIEYAVHDTADSVRQAAARIQGILNGRPTQVDTEPLPRP